MSLWRDFFRDRPTVVVSPQFWGDLWVSKHWIASKISEVAPVVFVEPPLWLAGIARQPALLRAHWRRLVSRTRSAGGSLRLFTPVFAPTALAGDWRDQLRTQARSLARNQHLDHPIVLNFGTNWSFVDGLAPSVHAYYCVDPVIAEPGIDDDERLTCQDADVIFAISGAYAEQLHALVPDKTPIVIPHAYAFEEARAVDADPRYLAPEELRHLPRPILGYVGSIHDAVIDIEIVEALAEDNASGTLVLIGPYRDNPLGDQASPELLARLHALPNVRLLGPRPFNTVPQYVKAFDVAMVLTNLRSADRKLKTGSRTLFKWLIYLSLGKPVVSPTMAEAEAIDEIIYLSRSPAEYVESVRRALTEPPELRARRIVYASQFTFDNALNRLAAGMAAGMAARSNRMRLPAVAP